jgi:uncharacterized protein YjbI with pentapeptide repeats
LPKKSIIVLGVAPNICRSTSFSFSLVLSHKKLFMNPLVNRLSFTCYSADEIAQSITNGKDLSNINLEGIDLSNRNLAAANWRGTILIRANLSYTNLSSAALEGADLRGANLTASNLEGANLENSYLYRAVLCGCNLSGVNLQGAKMALALYDSQTVWPENYDYRNCGAVGPRANLAGAYLNTANLRGADLQGANLRGAYLSGADLTGANLQEAALSGANLQGALLTGAYLRKAKLVNVELQFADLRGADLTEAILEQIQSLKGADFSGVEGLSDWERAYLCSRSPAELGTWNPYTRTNTAQSLGCFKPPQSFPTF